MYVEFGHGLLTYDDGLGIDILRMLGEKIVIFGKTRIADICCGRGDALQTVKRTLGERVETVGFDLVRLGSHAGLDQVITGDFQTIDIPLELIGACDVVVCYQGAHYFEQPRKALQQAASLVAPSGSLCIDKSLCTREITLDPSQFAQLGPFHYVRY